MIIHALHSKNFMRFREFELEDLPDQGLIGIFGDNECGKSSVGELICFCLFGRTTRAPESEPDRIIRWGEPECEASLRFSIGDTTYRIIRRMKSDGSQTGRLVNVTTDTLITAEAVDIENKITDLLNYGFKEFRYSTYIAQNEVDLILQQAGDRREVLNNMLGVGFMDRMAERAAGKRRDQEIELEKFNQRIDDKREVLDVYRAREEDLLRVEADIDACNRDLLAALKDRDHLVSTNTLMVDIKRKREQYEILDSRIKSRREKLRKLEAEAAELIRETDRIPALISENKEKEAIADDLRTNHLQELEEQLGRIDNFRDLMAQRNEQIKVIEIKEGDLSKLTEKLEVFAEKDEGLKKASQELTSIEFFLESFTGETRYRTMITGLIKDLDLLDTEIARVRDLFTRDIELAREKEKTYLEQAERIRRQKEATAVEEVTTEQLAALQEKEAGITRNRDIALAAGGVSLVAGTVLTLALGNILWLFVASPVVPAVGAAFVLRNTIGKTRQLVMTAQQKFYAYNITQRGLVELQDALDDTLDRAHKAAEEVSEVEKRFDLLTRIGRDSFRQLDASVALINESGLRELDRARGILEEILTGYENLRSLVKIDEPFKEIADLDPANLLVDHEERRTGLQQRIKHLSAELVGRDKFVEQSESYIRDIRGERERLSGIDRDIAALGITDEQEPAVKKAILETDLKIEQLNREIEQNQRDIKRIQAQADEAGFIEQKRREIIAEIDRDLIHFYELREATRDIDCTDEKFAGLKNQLDAAEQMVADCRGKINNLDAQRKIIQKDLERVRDVQTEIDGIAAEARAIEDAILKYRELETLFQSAGQDIKKRLVPQIESYFAWIMPRLTRGRYHQIRLSDDFDISVYSEEKQDFVNLDALSGGTMDQLLISLRLAFARAATSGDYYSNQFLFLDEPISSFDESRRELFFDLLETLKSGFQQIFLISHLPNLEEFTDAYIHVNLDPTPQPAVISWK